MLGYYDFEEYFPNLISELGNAERYYPIIKEYLAGKLFITDLTTKFMYYWNSLEHLTNIFWGTKNQTKIFLSSTFHRLRLHLVRSLREFFGSTENIGQFFPNTIFEQGVESIKNKINNSPPIKEKIKKMCLLIGYVLNNEEDQLIDKAYFFRNKLYHGGLELNIIFERYLQRFNVTTFTYSDYYNLIQKFLFLFERLLLQILNFIPNYLRAQEYRPLRQLLFWQNPIRRPINFGRERNDLTVEDRHIEDINTGLRVIKRKCKYLPLINFLENLSSRINETLENENIEGSLIPDSGVQEIQITFSEAFKGDFAVIINDRASWERSREALFKSNIENNSNQFYIEFPLYKSSECFSSPSIKRSEGRFLTSFIDIKKGEIENL